MHLLLTFCMWLCCAQAVLCLGMAVLSWASLCHMRSAYGCAVPCCAVLRCVVLQWAALCWAAPHCAVLCCCASLCCALPCCAMMRYAAVSRAVLGCGAPCCVVMLCCAVLFHVAMIAASRFDSITGPFHALCIRLCMSDLAFVTWDCMT